VGCVSCEIMDLVNMRKISEDKGDALTSGTAETDMGKKVIRKVRK